MKKKLGQRKIYGMGSSRVVAMKENDERKR